MLQFNGLSAKLKLMELISKMKFTTLKNKQKKRGWKKDSSCANTPV